MAVSRYAAASANNDDIGNGRSGEAPAKVGAFSRARRTALERGRAIGVLPARFEARVRCAKPRDAARPPCRCARPFEAMSSTIQHLRLSLRQFRSPVGLGSRLAETSSAHPGTAHWTIVIPVVQTMVARRAGRLRHRTRGPDATGRGHAQRLVSPQYGRRGARA